MKKVFRKEGFSLAELTGVAAALAAAVGQAVRLLGVRSSRERAGSSGKQQWQQQ